MGGTPHSIEIFNSREEFVSGDMVRAQNLASRDVQDALASSARTTNFSADPTSWDDPLTEPTFPISSLDILPTFASSTGFAVTVGPGSGYMYYTPGITADFSTYQALRWAQQDVTLANPDATNPRIDAITVAPGTVNTDTVSRNILVDPVARTVTAQSVNKTSNPLSTIAVVTGTAAVNPLAPAIPAGTGALFYVYVPAVAASSASFRACRGMWRRPSFPFAAASGVLAGMHLEWAQQDPTTTSAGLSIEGSDPGTVLGLQRILIDGEVLEWYGGLSTANGGVTVDTAHNPSTTAAGGSADTPFYIYAVGGRHNPMPSLSPGGAPSLNPVTIVQSTQEPNIATGMPKGGLTVNGVTGIQRGAVYIGLGFIVAGTTGRFRSMLVSGDMTMSGNNHLEGPTTTLSGGVGGTSMTLTASKPAFSTKVGILMDLAANSTATQRAVVLMNGSATGTGHSAPLLFTNVIGGATGTAFNSAPLVIPLAPFGVSSFKIITSDTADVLTLHVLGYNQRVNRFDGPSGA